MFTAGIGAEAIRKVLEHLDVDQTIENLKEELEANGMNDEKKTLQRLKLFQGSLKLSISIFRRALGKCLRRVLAPRRFGKFWNILMLIRQLRI
jgi:hypothetical protein